MSLKEMNDKLILGRENRNKRISIYNLPKINRKMESFRTSINCINNNVKNIYIILFKVMLYLIIIIKEIFYIDII